MRGKKLHCTDVIIGESASAGRPREIITIININERKCECCLASINSPERGSEAQIRRRHNSYGKVRGSARAGLPPLADE